MNQLLDKYVDVNNLILKNESIRIILYMISSVLIGYVLQPIPKWLNNLFDTSNILKFIILFVCGTVYAYPIAKSDIIYVFAYSVLALIVFEFARKFDKNVDDKNLDDKNLDDKNKKTE